MIRDMFKRSSKNKRQTPEGFENDVPEGLMTKCPQCKENTLTKELASKLKVCPACNHHFTMTANERVTSLFDENTFVSMDENLKTENPLGFPGYIEKVEEDAQRTGLNEAVLTGTGDIEGCK